jgi:hypothetical protein
MPGFSDPLEWIGPAGLLPPTRPRFTGLLGPRWQALRRAARSRMAA